MRCLALTAWLVACEHQYVAIPGAEVVEGTYNYAYTQTQVGAAAPTFVVVEGAPALSLGESVTVLVDFSLVVEVEVDMIVFLGLDAGDTEFGDHWQWPLVDEEIAQGFAEVEISALEEPPTQEWCQRDYRGNGVCYQEADEGVTGLGVAAAGGDEASTYGVFDLLIEPMVEPTSDTGSSDSCASFTADDCCGGSAGISVVQCNIDPVCGCPAGTADLGSAGDGTRICDCPG